eukprot:29327-Hanusia_phi.AAC.1
MREEDRDELGKKGRRRVRRGGEKETRGTEREGDKSVAEEEKTGKERARRILGEGKSEEDERKT